MAEYLLPTLCVLLAAFILPKWSVKTRWISIVMATAYAFLLVRYLYWRLTDTVLPVEMSGVIGFTVWFVFLVELLFWLEGANLIFVILNRTDRTPQADQNETASRASVPDQMPDIDVFIATYNEPLEVLEKTIAGALALDWCEEKLHIFVLDDGRRSWLKEYCETRGVTHLIRSDNNHAKAGNINAALKRTKSPFVLVLDADFVPLRNMLRRAIGFFKERNVGIVQMPHHFFNSDPVQVNLNLESVMPDEQRLFFDVIQPGRDGLDCAFCCGSNGILRREAIDAIGGELPTDSVTEDMLLTLAMLRKGYVTRYLNEKLAIGLAPENLQAYFVQRGRWAQGAIQIMYLGLGPFGRALRPLERLLFIPSHWISMSVCQPVAIALPAFFLTTGIPPIVNVSTAEIIYFQVPVVLASMVLMMHLAGRKFAPISSAAQSLLQALRVAPIVFSTLVSPSGHSFKVTPKGKEARGSSVDLYVFQLCIALFTLTAAGLFVNSNEATRVVTNSNLLPVVAFWAVFNMVILLLVAAMTIPRPIHRSEERFKVSQPCRLKTETELLDGRIVDASLSGLLVCVNDCASPNQMNLGDWVGIEFPEVGLIPGCIARKTASDVGPETLGVAFRLAPGAKRDRLIQKLFCEGLEQNAPNSAHRSLFALLMLRVLRPRKAASASEQVKQFGPENQSVPLWLQDTISEADRSKVWAQASFKAGVQLLPPGPGSRSKLSQDSSEHLVAPLVEE